MKYIRYVVMGVWLCCIGRLVTGDVSGVLGDIFCGLNGVFLLKDDSAFKSFHACLMKSPIGQCAGPSGGGMTCLMPFLVIAAMNVVFGLLALGGRAVSIFTLVSMLLQAVGAYLGWTVKSIMEAAYAGQDGMAMSGGQQMQPLNPGQQTRELRPQPDGGSGGGGGGFVPFSGTGQTLGG